MKITDPMLCIVVNKSGNAIEPKVIRQDAVIIRVAIRVYTRLKTRHDVGVLRGGDRAKENGGTVPG